MAKKKRKNKEKDLSNRVFLIIMSVALVLLLGVWIIKDIDFSKKGKETNVTEEADYSRFNKISVSDALKLAGEDKLTFIYFGYEGCNACDSFVPTLITIMEDYKITINYINTHELDRDSADWKKLTKIFDKQVTLYLKIDGENTELNKTIGKFLYEDGYTPSFVITKNGKLIDGNIGAMTLTKLKEFLNNAGFSEK